jgi:hypothetical protein
MPDVAVVFSRGWIARCISMTLKGPEDGKEIASDEPARTGIT